MLSHCLGFRPQAGSGRPTCSLAPKSRETAGASASLFPYFLAPPYPNVTERGNGVMSRRCHCDTDKGILLYFRSRSESVVVIFANYRSICRYYRAYISRLCMLTCRIVTLSKPVIPFSSFSAGLSVYLTSDGQFQSANIAPQSVFSKFLTSINITT